MLDEEQNNPFYLRGRIFAVLESLEVRAHKDKMPVPSFFHRCFALAAQSPDAALAQGHLQLAGWLGRLDAAEAEAYRARLRDLHDRLGGPAEPFCGPEDGSRFHLGYFHQQSALLRSA